VARKEARFSGSGASMGVVENDTRLFSSSESLGAAVAAAAAKLTFRKWSE